MLSHLLSLQGVDSIVLEARTRQYVEERVRAGVLEQGTVDLLVRTGVGDRLKREGLVHRGIEISFKGSRHRIDLSELTGGKCITVYAQHEVLKDLIAARLGADGQILFNAEVCSIDAMASSAPKLNFRQDGRMNTVSCDFVAGCDGSHGVCRPSIPEGALTIYEKNYPFAWLGILAAAPPSSEELVYTRHDRGFALFSMRSPQITRLYFQCACDEDLDRWPDDRIWDEIQTRMATADGWAPVRGAILQKGITAVRSFVAEPMRHGSLFLAGDAAHSVPPTGAKGLNLAIADVHVLARALGAFYESGHRDLLDRYSETCLRRIWKVQRFSWWMTSMLHRFEADNAFDRKRQLGELDYLTTSRTAATTLAENYVGLPME